MMPAENRRILVVGDKAEIREMLELNLQLRGFAVKTAAGGLEGLSFVRDWDPDLIILDIHSPKVDGFTVLPAFRRLTQAPVIMLTAKSVEDGADDYLAKPFEMAELVARLQTQLHRSLRD